MTKTKSVIFIIYMIMSINLISFSSELSTRNNKMRLNKQNNLENQNKASEIVTETNDDASSDLSEDSSSDTQSETKVVEVDFDYNDVNAIKSKFNDEIQKLISGCSK